MTDPASEEEAEEAMMAPPVSPTNLISRIAHHLLDYVVISREQAHVVAAWIVAAWLAELWDRFPLLAITSAEKRCGKTRFLEVLEGLVPNPRTVVIATAAAIFREVVPKDGHYSTLLYDEAQSVTREGREDLREMFCSGISKKATVPRSVPASGGWVTRDFPIYGPKVLAAKGQLDDVLADRCICIRMKRREKEELKKYRSYDLDPIAFRLQAVIRVWAKEHKAAIAKLYKERLVPECEIASDRMAELLNPLQCVVVEACDVAADAESYEDLERFARAIDEEEKNEERQSDGVRLLTALREIFGEDGASFILTRDLIAALYDREEEPWKGWNHGRGLSPESLAKELRAFEIRSTRNTAGDARGYYRDAFADSWRRYL